MARKTTTTSPPQSTPSSPSVSSSRSSPRPQLSLDLSNLPPLTRPAPPTNTLLITDLHDLHLFQPSSLDAIRARLNSIAPLNSFSPLPSFRRIVCSFYTADDAVSARQDLESHPLLDRKVYAKIYFGEPTPILDEEEARPKLLEAPQMDKLFFISPPPSPPHGWVMRNEDPPNKEVHADDLTQALSNLKTKTESVAAATASAPSSASDVAEPSTPVSASANPRQRSRSSTIIYNPEHHGGSPGLPAVMVEDTTLGLDLDLSDMDISPVETAAKKAFKRTTRPPLELME